MELSGERVRMTGAGAPETRPRHLDTEHLDTGHRGTGRTGRPARCAPPPRGGGDPCRVARRAVGGVPAAEAAPARRSNADGTPDEGRTR
ncbi:hypothetical protein [Streptomyces sp. NPDC016675]|uniref:hypothetical protein n=1 Tax=Streptomyces sp. NPDC016675 TaxID=3364970 RepID=UPI0037000BB6